MAKRQALKVHHTDTGDGGWDGEANVARLRLGEEESYYRQAFAWQDPDGDAGTKGAYKFIHHYVDGEGSVGAASTRACSAGIGVLNGGRGGTTIPEGDREGVYSHVAAHLRDAGMEPPELNSLERGIEVRCLPMEMRVEPTPDQAGEERQSPLLEGYAAVFGHLSETMWGFREIIEEGFFDDVLGNDVRSLWNHNADYVLGRVKSGTLFVFQDKNGLGFRARPPETQWARDALVSIGRGDVDQASFAFTVKLDGDEWRKEADGGITRVLKRGGCEMLYDVSPVTFPAYALTSVLVRSKFEKLSGSGGPGEPESRFEGHGESTLVAGQPKDGEAEAEARRLQGRLDVLRKKVDLAELDE